MRQTFYSDWFNTNLLLLVVAGMVLYASVSSHQHKTLGLLFALGSIIWVIVYRYTTYVSFSDNQLLINSNNQIFRVPAIRIPMILYIARTPQYVFRSWGGRMMIFYRSEGGRILQTSLIEQVYSHETLRAILLKLMESNPRIELDEEYAEFVKKYDPNAMVQLKSTPSRRTMTEVEKHVSSKYGSA